MPLVNPWTHSYKNWSPTDSHVLSPSSERWIVYPNQTPRFGHFVTPLVDWSGVFEWEFRTEADQV
jgi:hypothetical protein